MKDEIKVQAFKYFNLNYIYYIMYQINKISFIYKILYKNYQKIY